MADGVYVNVTEPLADSLAGDGFRQAGIKRGIDPGWALAPASLLEALAEFDEDRWAAIPRSRP